VGNPSPSAPTPLTGRAGELGQLAALVDSAADGRGNFVLIGGDAGIGKTRLCDEAAAIACERGFVVLRGQCLEGEEALPYLPIVELIEAVADMLAPDELYRVVGASAHQLATLVPRLAGEAPAPAPPLPSDGERLRLFTAVRDFFDRASRIRPLLIIVEDMHWADAATATLVRNLLLFAGARPVLALATYRPGEVEPPQGAVARLAEDAHRSRAATVIQLGELARPDVAQMVERITGAHPGEAGAEALFSQTGGNPFFVEQVLKHLAEEDRLFDAAGTLHLQPTEGEAVPESVRLVIDRRLRRIDERCRVALATAAVLGRSFDCAVLADVDGRAPGELIEALEQAERARVVVAETRPREQRMAFTHDLIRQTLLTQLSSARGQQLHLRIAEAIERRYGATDDTVADLAHHYLRAGAAADAAHTIDCLLRAAARASAATGFEQAAMLYRDAFGLVPPADGARRCELVLLSGEAL
jgi:predicted ATPase